MDKINVYGSDYFDHVSAFINKLNLTVLFCHLLFYNNILLYMHLTNGAFNQLLQIHLALCPVHALFLGGISTPIAEKFGCSVKLSKVITF